MSQSTNPQPFSVQADLQSLDLLVSNIVTPQLTCGKIDNRAESLMGRKVGTGIYSDVSGNASINVDVEGMQGSKVGR